MWQSTSKGLFSIVDRAYLYSEQPYRVVAFLLLS